MPMVAPMVTAVVAGPAARLEVQGPLGCYDRFIIKIESACTTIQDHIL